MISQAERRCKRNQIFKKKKEQLEEEIRDLQERIEKEIKYKPITEKEFREFGEEILRFVESDDDFDKKEGLKELLMKNKDKSIGYKEHY